MPWITVRYRQVSAGSLATTSARGGDLLTYPPTVLIRACPPSAQYRLTST